ncbi:MOSC domain-containing protein [Phycicoccus flavus]|uniref:MOSC domain-containing protein n=1 Tax=Phycicoccus flavus TaxID=2502783 RepID=UPI00197C57BE|nr:MOSC domain-containing protein [Phycicoccus flavus]
MTDPAPPPVVVGLHLAPGRRLPMHDVDAVVLEAGAGIVGDRYHGSRHRHVTLQAADDLAVAGERLAAPVPAGRTRRNVTVDRGPVVAVPGARARLGEALLEVVRVAAPCRIMDDEVAPGAARALHGLAGTVFRVVEGGRVALGDAYVEIPVDPDEARERAAASRAAATARGRTVPLP